MEKQIRTLLNSWRRNPQFNSPTKNAIIAQIMFSTLLNPFILRNLKILEMTGVLMRIGSFSLVAWLNTESPFMLVWIVNTTDAILLTWCAVLKRDSAYTVLNAFWIIIGAVGIARAAGWLH